MQSDNFKKQLQEEAEKELERLTERFYESESVGSNPQFLISVDKAKKFQSHLISQTVDKTLDLVRKRMEGERVLGYLPADVSEEKYGYMKGYNQALDDLTNYLNSLKK